MTLTTLDRQNDLDGMAHRQRYRSGGPASHQEIPGAHRGFHQPVLVQEVLLNMNLKPDGVYLDATVGEGGHAIEVLNTTSPHGRLVGLDRDPRSLDQAIRRLSSYAPRFIGVWDNYTEMGEVCRSHRIEQVDGVLMDLGFSSRQIEEPGYGFSFRVNEPLDMRYDPEQSLTAAEITNSYPQDELADIIYRFGEERRSRAIARAIVQARPVNTTQELAQVVAGSLRPAGRAGRPNIHPATRTFQAFRIAVNGELEHLQSGLEEAIKILAPQGRLVVISYHSLEDRIVKTVLAREAAQCICPPRTPECVCGHQPRIMNVNRRVIKPSLQEMEGNPRSRSARMRVAQRL